MFFIKFKVSMNIYKRPHVQKSAYARVVINYLRHSDLFSTSVEVRVGNPKHCPAGPFTKVMKNGSKDFLDFRYKVRHHIPEKSSTAGFLKKNPKFFYKQFFIKNQGFSHFARKRL